MNYKTILTAFTAVLASTVLNRNCLASYPLGWGKGGLRICGERSWRLM